MAPVTPRWLMSPTRSATREQRSCLSPGPGGRGPLSPPPTFWIASLRRDRERHTAIPGQLREAQTPSLLSLAGQTRTGYGHSMWWILSLENLAPLRGDGV